MTVREGFKKRMIQKHVRLNGDELAELKQRAGKMRLSVYLRHCALGRPPINIPATNAQAIRELNRIGSNLNQLVHAAHRTSRTADLEKIMSKVFAESCMLSSLIDQIETGRMDASSDFAQA